jgi:hypothetical protein
MSSVLLNGSEAYASRMMLILELLSVSAMSRCSSWLTMRLPAQYQLSDGLMGEILLPAYFLLEVKSLDKVKKYPLFSPSSLLVIKFISVERREEVFSLP